MEELEIEMTVSGNDATSPIPANEEQPDLGQEDGILQETVEEQPIESYVDTLQVTVQLYGQDYTEMLGSISGNSVELSVKLDRIIELLEQTVSQNSIEEDIEVEETVSENTVSDNTISQNALIYTKLQDYGLTDSLLLVTNMLLLFLIVVLVFFRKGEK